MAGQTDWRLPKVIELTTLIDYTRADPAINTSAFPNTPIAEFWTDTQYNVNVDRFWDVSFGDGLTYEWNLESDMSRVRCVRPGITGAPAARYVVVAGGIRDNYTGLVWQEPLSEDTYVFSAAQTYCASLGAGWRAPTTKEAQTLVDRLLGLRPYDPIFAFVPDSDFWTSSRHAKDTTSAWSLGRQGHAWPLPMTQVLPVRCVK